MCSRWVLFVCWSNVRLSKLHVAQSQNNITMLISLTVWIVSPQQSPCWGVNHQSSGQDDYFFMEHENSLRFIEESDTACGLSYINLVITITLYFTKVFWDLRVVKSRRMRWAGHVGRMGEDRGVHRVLVGKPERKRLLGTPRRRWEDNIKNFQKVEGGRGD
jgi:hypothetical protein